MNSKVFTKTISLGSDIEITLETGKLARQADGAIILRQGDAVLLATVVAAQESRPDVDFMPLSCEYKEKYASVGRFPGGFLKREARPSDYEIIIARLVDRALRPLFPADYHADTFVTVQLISSDKDVMPDQLAGLAASAALTISDIPFNGPISEVRVARVDGQFIVNPTFEQNDAADMEIMVAATLDNIMMVEGEMKEVSEADMLDAIKVAHAAIKIQCQAQLDLMNEMGKGTKREVPTPEGDEELKAKMETELYDKVYAVAKECINDKHLRGQKFAAVKDEFIAGFGEDEEINKSLIGEYYHDIEKRAIRRMILDDKVRLDGRKTDEIRQITCDVDYLPSPHGSAVFTRGETQSLTTVTLGSKMDEQMIDGVTYKGYEKFILHYNFPPFSTGDARPVRGLSRREVGHGNLAYRALKSMVPNAEEGNPYTVRVVSDILESNGSSSMATVCAGCLALMDAGVQMKKPVSGIAMGLITDTDSDKFAVLSDILGDEDHLGDMDFKVTGTKDGITATQMDIKVDGLPYEVLAQALDQARNGRLHILEKMSEALAEPRTDYKDHVPRIEKIIIDKEFIGAIIGPGGKVIQQLQKDTGTTIVIEEVDEKGIIDIVSDDKESIEKAKAMIKGIVAVPEVGEVYEGLVKTITAFGAFVEIIPGKDGLLHISEIDHTRVTEIEKYFNVGDRIQVKLIEVDQKTGKLKLSRKVLLPKPE